jgi:CRISPR-associated endonuclease/helicase Cas3
MTVRADQFDAFFGELWGYDPFPWQCRLAQQVCEGSWPGIIDLPTASGKTACLDIAVFALAVQAARRLCERTVGRRIFFVVNRRVIVDEAHERAREIARHLREAIPGSVLRAVADELHRVGGDGDAPPLDVAILRGGIYRDNRWARSISQPTIITSTIDQVGSRLLFRGYGVSEAARPLHAALIAHDSLLMLDEAHISQPFAQTLDAARRYRGETWATQPIATPFDVVQMTATPSTEGMSVFRQSDDDRRHPVLAARRNVAKLAKLLCADKAKGGNALDELAKVMAGQAMALQAGNRKTVAVIVNRVATARRVYELLNGSQKDQAEVYLAIGRMRPIDRGDLTKTIQARVGKAHQEGADDKPLFVVATQCLEVGADFDFDGMVSECASLDALRQRFGRLNRKGRGIDARGCIVVRGNQIKSEEEIRKFEEEGKLDDPIYGNALARTWNWLQRVAVQDGKEKRVDFGIAAMERTLSGVDLSSLLASRADAPVMFPAYVDAWAQTSPTPAPDPDVALFLHGPQRGEPEVQVCWRSGLPDSHDRDVWAQIIGMCPPSSSECMPVPIGVFKAWLAEKDTADEHRGDLLDELQQPDEPQDGKKVVAKASISRVALAWRGLSDSRLVNSPADVRPGDTLVLPVKSGGWAAFGHIPGAPDDPADADRIDIAELAFRKSHGRVILRLTPSRLVAWPKCEAVAALKAWIGDPDMDLSIPKIHDAIRQVADTMPAESAKETATLRLLANKTYGLTFERYPDPEQGGVLATRRRVSADDSFMPAMDDGQDETSRIAKRERVSLKDHTDHVSEVLGGMLRLIPVETWAEALRAAARLHDLGKADKRFQALLVNGTLDDAWAQPTLTLWAKSDQMSMSPAQRLAAHRRSLLPAGFRHEMLSAQLAESLADLLPANPIQRDLALHLISSHHGYGRPFAPVVIDDAPLDVSLSDPQISLTGDQRRHRPAHRLDSGIAERFWILTRHFGWWGLAYLEATLRLADQRASQREDEGLDATSGNLPQTQETTA